jgi:hypothetical protein
MSSNNLNDAAAIVTGATRGVGPHIAAALGEQGACAEIRAWRSQRRTCRIRIGWPRSRDGWSRRGETGGCRYLDPIFIRYTGAPFPGRGPDRVCFVIAVEKAAQLTLGFVHNPAGA